MRRLAPWLTGLVLLASRTTRGDDRSSARVDADPSMVNATADASLSIERDASLAIDGEVGEASSEDATSLDDAAAGVNDATSGTTFPLEKYKLGNGLEVILHEDHRVPLVAVNVWYHVGSKDEPTRRNGFAHLFEHMMFQGSRNVGEDQFFRYLERAGASDRNGTTNTDRTNYYETLPSSELELALWLESDRMGFLLDHAGRETFEGQREVVKNERRQNYENAPYGLVVKHVREALYPEGHPYRLLTIGDPADLDAATLEDVQGFFRTFYRPNNASLVVAGDIDRTRTKALVAMYFGSLPPGPEPSIVTSAAPIALDHEVRLELEADVALPRVSFVWPTPAQFAPGDAELDGIAQILAGGRGSRLHRRLVTTMKLAQDVVAHQQSGALASTFEVVVTARPTASPAASAKLLDDIQKVVDEELTALRAAPPTASETQRARAKNVTALTFGMERLTARADAFNHYAQFTDDPGYFDRDLDRYQSIHEGSLHEAVRAHLGPGRVVARVIPEPSAPRAGRLRGAP